MPKFKCEKCSYQTANRTDFNSHLNRKMACNPNKPNKNIKNNIDFVCKICNQVFSRSDSLKRHNQTFHITHNDTNNLDINGNDNNSQNIDGNNNKQTVVIKPIINITNIYDYKYNDVNDLTLFEQYQSLTSKNSPYTSLLDHLNLNPNKPKYQNIHLGSIHKNTMDVHNGEEWIKEIVNSALCQIVDTKRIMIGIIFNRFRCFLSKKATNLTKKAFYYGCQENFYFHKQIVQNIKVHLYNKRNNKNAPDTNIPDDRNDEVWWALSKLFNWKEVARLIRKMDKLKVDFDKNANEIKAQILAIIQDKPEKKQFFCKLLKQLDSLINDFEISNESESSPDENDNTIEV